MVQSNNLAWEPADLSIAHALPELEMVDTRAFTQAHTCPLSSMRPYT